MDNIINDPHLLLDILEGDVPNSLEVTQRIVRVERGDYVSMYAWYEAAKLIGKNFECKLNPKKCLIP